MPDSKKLEYQIATTNDKILQLLKIYTEKGWPLKKDLKDNEIKQYYKIKTEINVTDDLLFFNHKLIVPEAKRNHLLQVLHESHTGIEKTKLRARQLMFWPGMNLDIEQYINNCANCKKFARSNQKEPAINRCVPNHAWDIISVDLFEFGNKDYLIVMDAFSNWIEILALKSKSIDSVIFELKKLFSSFGYPNVIISDNIPFNSFKFRQFVNEHTIITNFSSPYHHQSNGLAEKGVSIAKKMFRTLNDSNRLHELDLVLLEYRNMPLPAFNLSPAQMFFNRQLKTHLPVNSESLKPQPINWNEIQNQRHQKTLRQNKYYNRSTKELPALKKDDPVLIQTHLMKNNVWLPGRVLDKLNFRKYLVEDEKGQQLVRNRIHLKQTNQTLTNHEANSMHDSLPSNIEMQLDNTDLSNTLNRTMDEYHSLDETDDASTPQPCISIPSTSTPLDNCENATIHTRSGRVIRPPSYLKLYDTTENDTTEM